MRGKKSFGKTHARDLGMCLCLATNGAVIIAERVPETRFGSAENKWLPYLSKEFPLTERAAEELRMRLCHAPGALRDSQDEWIAKCAWERIKKPAGTDHSLLSEEFLQEFNEGLAALVKDHWREGAWVFPPKDDVS